MIPGEIVTEKGDVALNEGRATRRLMVANTADRPIQVGSHYHFYETNAALEFAREEARGYRLNIPAGTAVRFEPGEEKEVELTEFGGARVIHGGNGLVRGALGEAGARERAIERAKNAGFLSDGEGETR